MKILRNKSLSKKHTLLISVGIILLIILFHVFLVKKNLYGSDYSNYIQGADSFLNQRPYSTHGDKFIPDNFRPPGYPIIIAFFKWLSKDYFNEILIFFQSVLLSSMFLILIRTLNEFLVLKNKTIIFALILFCHPVLINTATSVQPHFLQAFLLISFIYNFVRFIKRKQNKYLIKSIFFFSLSFYLRPTFIYYTPILIFFIFRTSNIKLSIYSLALIMFVVSPWIIRNKVILNSYNFSGLGNISLSYYAAEALRHKENISSEEAHQIILKNSNAIDYEKRKNDSYLSKRLFIESKNIIITNLDYFIISYFRGILRVFLMPHNIFSVKNNITLNVDQFIKIMKYNRKSLFEHINIYFIPLYIFPYLINIFYVYGLINAFLKRKFLMRKYYLLFAFIASFLLYAILIPGPINRSQYMISYINILIIFLITSTTGNKKYFSLNQKNLNASKKEESEL